MVIALLGCNYLFILGCNYLFIFAATNFGLLFLCSSFDSLTSVACIPELFH